MAGAGMIVSAAANYAGQMQALAARQAQQRAINAAVTAEAKRQGVFQQQGESLYQQNAIESSPAAFERDTNAGASSRTAGYRGAAMQPMVGNGNKAAVSPAAALQSAILQAILNQSRAQLGGRQDAANAWTIRNNRVNVGQGLVNNFSQGSANIAPYEIQNGLSAGEKNRQLAALLGMVSSAAGGMGAM
jgi:hypothetical protein